MTTMTRARDHAAAAMSWAVFGAIVAVFGWMLGDIIAGGWQQIEPKFFTDSPASGGRAGGIAPILVSTLWIVAVALAAATPVGLATAVLLAEFTRRSRRLAGTIRLTLDILAGVPSIVFGLFGNVFFCVTLGLGFSILSGGLTLACMILPLLVRSLESGLRAVPESYRKAGAALGFCRTDALIHVLLPAATPSLLAGLVLGLGRAAAETAALIFTSGYVDRMPGSLWDSGRSLSIHIYDLAMNIPGGDRNAYGSALVLMGVLLALNGTFAVASRRWTETRMKP